MIGPLYRTLGTMGGLGLKIGGGPLSINPNPTGDDSQLISHNIPTSVTAGTAFSFQVIMKNIGITTWTYPYNYALNEHPYDTFYAYRSVPHDSLGVWTNVAPGETYTFSLGMNLPAGTYSVNFKMIHEELPWGENFFGQSTPIITITAS